MEDSLVEDLVQNTNHPMVKKVVLLSIFVLVLLVALYHNFFSAPNYDNPKIIMIPRGSSVKSVGDLLYTNKIVRSASVYNSINQFISKDSAVSGAYLFRGDENVFSVANRITSGDFRLPSVKITFPEGITIEEIAIMCEKSLPLCNKGNFLRLAANKEGYLFPDTYSFLQSDNETDVIDSMSRNFLKKTGTISKKIITFGKPLDEIIIMASIIEKEGSNAENRKMISSILWKRISINMPLQVDATLGYAFDRGSFELTKADLKSDSPYNTYKFKGLPKTPICNPGLESIEAAVSPEKTSYLYYLTDKNGGFHYSKTFEEHVRNKSIYFK